MATGTVAVLMKIGFISEEMTKPRQLSGVSKILFSTVAVAYSYFFLHIAVFGPPVSEIFKGTFFMGVAVMSLLLFKSRQRSLKQGFVWLDEFFALVSMIMLVGAIAVLVHWAAGGQEYFWRRYVTDTVWTIGIIGGFVGAALYFFEAQRGGRGDGLVISDVVYLSAAIASVTWWGVNLVELQTNMGGRVPAELVIFGTMMAGVSFEIARRIVGPLIPLLGFLFFIYSFEPIAQSLPGILEHPGNRTARVLEFLMLSTEGMLGLIVEVFATFIVIFVILGAFLEKTGLGALIINTTYRLTGQKTGGPGLAAVISSGFFGMISGSGVANVMTTGTFTIPLMKRVGYRPEFAAGVEAAASTGGAYMPPIMGAGAFLLAELTETSYFDIVKIAAIPALLYYLSVGLIVYFRARRDKLHGVPASELPSWDGILPRLHLLLPIPAMIFFLVIGDSAFLAA
ncbi:MAG: TRAP transporter large permease subunit, partial [Rhodospirillales bacterium]|nr:TRAP transporter large permease subunit [Rhodospirillales bacterium]